MTAVRIRAAGVDDRAAVARLLRGLSAESSYRRFQTGLGPDPGSAVLDAMLPQGLRGGAVVAVVDDEVDGHEIVGHEIVGHGVWARVGAAAEIALVVTDAQQGKGIGTALADALVAELTARGITEIEVFATATNEAVARMVARQAPDAERERDGATVTYRLRVAARQRSGRGRSDLLRAG